MPNMQLSKIQPSQLFVNEDKLSRVIQNFDSERPGKLEPIPIKKLGNEIISTDGLTRALAAYLYGPSELPVVWDQDELDWEAYQIRVIGVMMRGLTPSPTLKKGSSTPKIMKGFG
jgi:hypothetical protein